MPNSVWASDRLVYRPISKADEEYLLYSFQDAEAWVNRVSWLPRPTGSNDVEAFIKRTANNLLAVMICLPGPPTEGGKPTTIPIGFLGLFGIEPNMMHHRGSGIGLSIDTEYRGKGYGSEAIQWAIYWGFRRAGLHRIEIGAYEYNVGACKLYPRLGFRLESTKVKSMWHDGRWWDAYGWAMLEDEYEQRYGGTAVAERAK